eukprot:COSAG01_NODE_1110_length_11657_cov_5.360616_4_plen_672_part_00
MFPHPIPLTPLRKAIQSRINSSSMLDGAPTGQQRQQQQQTSCATTTLSAAMTPTPSSAEQQPTTDPAGAPVVSAAHAHSEFWLPALRLCAEQLGWKVDTQEGEGVGLAIGVGRPPPLFVYLPPHASRFAFSRAPLTQRFPGMRFATRKVALGRALGWLDALVPGCVPWAPQSWGLPTEMEQLQQAGTADEWLIVKPDAGCRGNGIVLCRGTTAAVSAWREMEPAVAAGKKEMAAAAPEPEPRGSDADSGAKAAAKDTVAAVEGPPAVVQRYISHPWLWDGCKWDLRLYVLVTAVSPDVVAFLAPTALARRCTVVYEPPTEANASCARMHLSNTSVNAVPTGADKARQDDGGEGSDDGDAECKHTLDDAWAELRRGGVDTAALWATIRDELVPVTLDVMAPALSLAYEQTYPPARGSGRGRGNAEPAAAAAGGAASRCFQVLGLDVMIDEGGAPHLLEVNHNPSFAVPTKLDKQIKGSVLLSTLCQVLGGDQPAKVADDGAVEAAAGREEGGGLTRLDWEPVPTLSAATATSADDHRSPVQLLRQLRQAFDGLRRARARSSSSSSVSPLLACIGSPCLRHCVHGAPIGIVVVEGWRAAHDRQRGAQAPADRAGLPGGRRSVRRRCAPSSAGGERVLRAVWAALDSHRVADIRLSDREHRREGGRRRPRAARG